MAITAIVEKGKGRLIALWTFKKATFTPVAVADAVNYTDAAYMALIGGSTTQVLKISEVYEGGQASVTSPMIMLFSRDSTVEATPTALSTGESMNALDPATAALAAPMIAFTASTTKPQRSATLGLLNLSFNAWGGVVCWKSAQGEELLTLGNTASFGEVSLSAFTGGTMGLMGGHVVFEPRLYHNVTSEDLGDGGSKTHRHHRSNRKTTSRERLAPYISGGI